MPISNELQIVERWIEAFLECWKKDVAFSVEAQRAMVRLGISAAEIMRLMQTGNVLECEKEAVGATVYILGEDCDDREIGVRVWIETNAVRVEVLSVGRLQ